jgi:putative phosphoesterase
VIPSPFFVFIGYLAKGIYKRDSACRFAPAEYQVLQEVVPMRIAIVSDTHSRHATVETVLEMIDERGVELIIHCGDIEDADTVWMFPPNTHFVFGNCDSERASLRQAIHGIGGTLHEPVGKLELEGSRIAFIHSDDKKLFEKLEASGQYDYLFYGHTHVAEEHRTGPTRVINPGALHRARPKTFVILDLKSGESDSILVNF